MSELKTEVTREDGWEYYTDLATGQVWTRETGQTDGDWIAVPAADAAVTKSMGRREFHTGAGGQEWSRKVNADGQRGNWKPIQKLEKAVEQPKNHLFLVRETQASGGPLHWSLVVAPEDGGSGKQYQVTGDAVHMHYGHVADINIFSSDAYFDSQRLGELDADGENSVDSIAHRVEPPHAETQADVRSNCQDWAVQVVQELEDGKVVPEGSAVNCAAWYDYDSNGARFFG